MALKILLTCLLITITVSSTLSSPKDHHRAPSHNHRTVWPVWYRNRLFHARHDRLDDERVVRETTTIRSPWTLLPQMFTTRLPQQINSALRQHVEQWTPKHEFNGAVATAKYGNARAIAYMDYHGNRWHQPREAITQSYQLVPTTVPTYSKHQSDFFCCSGWSQITHLSFGCNKPTCPALCLNGGICTSPGKCTCPKGYTGNQCQTDVDECAIEKPCGQICTNVPGSYRCHCRTGFQLQQDGQSCRKTDTDESAFEARDLESDLHDVLTTKTPTISHDTENEVSDDDQDYEVILKRLIKLEKRVARSRKRDTETSEINAKVTLAVENVNEMKRTVENVQLMQQEVYDMKSKMKKYEEEMRKMQRLTSRVAELENHLRIRYKSPMSINSGSLNF